MHPIAARSATGAIRAALPQPIDGHQSVLNGLLAFCHRPGLLLGVWAVFPIRSDPRVAGNAVSPALVPGRTGGRDHASEPRRCRLRSRCWLPPSARAVRGATFASTPGLQPHPVQRNATNASIRIRAHESESIEVLITPNQPGSCPLRGGRCSRSIGMVFTFAGLRRQRTRRARGDIMTLIRQPYAQPPFRLVCVGKYRKPLTRSR